MSRQEVALITQARAGAHAGQGARPVREPPEWKVHAAGEPTVREPPSQGAPQAGSLCSREPQGRAGRPLQRQFAWTFWCQVPGLCPQDAGPCLCWARLALLEGPHVSLTLYDLLGPAPPGGLPPAKVAACCESARLQGLCRVMGVTCSTGWPPQAQLKCDSPLAGACGGGTWSSQAGPAGPCP